ncbi:MAG TPA: hypothetical protein VFV38_52030 [Ktedonobacteraceae bacterium]|nr:hypothetical protein [Ktedonobacteraceae bacterium]
MTYSHCNSAEGQQEACQKARESTAMCAQFQITLDPIDWQQFGKEVYWKHLRKMFVRCLLLKEKRPGNETTMKIFSQARAIFLAILAELKRQEGPGTLTQAFHIQKAWKIGKWCSQTEDLSQSEHSFFGEMFNAQGAN